MLDIDTARYAASKVGSQGRVVHICISKLTNIGSDNVLSSGWRQAIIWTNVRILLVGLKGTNFSEIVIEILSLFFKQMRLRRSSAKLRQLYLGLNVLSLWRIMVVLDYLHVWRTSYIWALWSIQMFTSPLFQITLHLLNTVLFSGIQSSPKALNPLSWTVPGKFDWSDSHCKHDIVNKTEPIFTGLMENCHNLKSNRWCDCLCVYS